jgi:hypothetical protein
MKGDKPMNMSFHLTTPQMRRGEKDVTRRPGWAKLKPGDRFFAIEKGQGLKKGEKVKRICQCECVSNTKEMLFEIVRRPFRGVRSECAREGFPLLSPCEFVQMFCREMGVTQETMVNRIEFKRV